MASPRPGVDFPRVLERGFDEAESHLGYEHMVPSIILSATS